MSVELKIKQKTLAAEAYFIRFEKRKAKAANRRRLASSLNEHRVNVVRKAARTTHLACCFLRGTPYKMVEATLKKSTRRPNWDVIEKMIKKYGKGDSRDLMQRFSAWKAE